MKKGVEFELLSDGVLSSYVPDRNIEEKVKPVLKLEYTFKSTTLYCDDASLNL